jgi:hypothetical protein
MERRFRAGIHPEGALNESRRSDLLQKGLDYSGKADSPGVQPAPTWRPLAGSSANNRGQARIITLATLLGGPEQRIPSIVQSQRGNGSFDAELISVRLGLFMPAEMVDINTGIGPYTIVPVNVVAELEFGVGGVSYTAEADWNQGTVFGISASYLRVSARVGEIPAIAFPDIDINLQASLAYGESGNTGISSPARRTILMGPRVGATPTPTFLAPGATAIIVIPIWAIGVTIVDGGGLVGVNPVIPDYTLQLAETVGGSMATYKITSRTNEARQIEGQFPIPVRARFLVLTNNLPISVKNPQAIFNLAF